MTFLFILMLFPLVLVGSHAEYTIKDAWNEFHVEDDMQEDDYYKLGTGYLGYTSHELDEFYFDSHDLDHNNMLDGLELHHSLDKQNVPSSKREELIDFILSKADEDKDGYLDFAEFLNSRTK